MCGRWASFIAAAAFLLPNAGAAQVQVNQNFVPLGPSPSFGSTTVVQSGDASPNGTVSGAVQAIVLDPALGSNTMFIASPNGGIWRTTNGGTTWSPLTDHQASLSIASLGLDPSDTSGTTLIAGIGLTSNGIFDAFNRANRAGSGGQKTGLLYSTDGGNNWTPMGTAQLGGSQNGQSVIGVAALGKTILAATFEPQAPNVTTTSGGASYGLYRSLDGGQSFRPVSGVPGSGLPAGPVTALVADPRNSGVCATQNSCTFYAGVTSPSNPQATGIYISNNSGQTWRAVFRNLTPVSGGTNVITGATKFQLVPKLAAGPNGSVAIAIAQLQPDPSSSNCVQPNCNGQQLTGLYLSQNGGQSWSALAVPPTNKGVMSAAVNLAVAIDPSNTSTIYVTGDGIPQSPFTLAAFRVQGQTFTSLTNNSTAHSDSRVLMMDAAGNLLMGGDGGIYMRSSPQSDNGTWTGFNSSTLQIREPFVAAYAANAHRLIVAAQDTGVAVQSAPNSVLFNAIQPADGQNATVSDKTFANQSVYYSSWQFLGDLSRLVLDSRGNRVDPGTAANGVPVTCNGQLCESEVVGNWHFSPFVLNKVDPTHVALAGSHVYVATDTAPASAPNVNLILTDLGATGRSVSALAYGTRDNPNVVLAGNDNGVAPATGALYLSTTGTPGSIAEVAGYTGQIPTSVVFDQRSQNRFYVADSFNLWGTQNQGLTPLQNLTPNLPANIIRPTSAEFINNNGVDALLVGGLSSTANAQSQIAVADSDDNGNLSRWRPFGFGLPNVLVSQMSYNPLVDVLAISAVGRGVWTLYDVTSYFPQATALQFGLANNDSQPDASFLTDGTSLNGTGFSRPLNKYGTGTLTIAGNATYTGGTTIFGGALQLGTGGASGSILGDVAFCSDGTNSLCDPSTNKFLAFNRSDVYTFAGAISGPGQVQQIGPGTTILTANNSYTGGTIISAGTLQVTNNNSVGTGVVTLDGGIFQAGADGLNFSNPFNLNTTGGAVDTNGNTLTLGGVIADGNGPGTLAKISSGRLVLTAASSYTGPTFVNAGTLSVNGSIASSPVFVNPGGTLGGNGVVGPTTILAAGTLSPGNSVGTLTVNGNLVFAAASLYMVEVQGNTADRTNASGTATLAGTVGAVNLGGIPARSYTILSAAAGRIGTFDSLTALNLPAFLTASLAYTPTDVQLNLTSGIGQITGLTLNQSAVAAALDTSFNTGGGTLPGLLGLSLAQLPAALDALSGEGVSGTQETAFGAADMFTSIMMDQGAFWRNGETIDVNGVAFAGEPLQYAPSKKSKMSDHRAFKEMAPPAPYQPRWRAWLTGFDGAFKLAGEAGIGSADLSHNTGGLAGGLDYQFGPDLLAGFAIGGSSSNFAVRDRITSGHLEGAHFGGYGVKTWGSLYAAGALSFGTFRNSETRSIAGIGPTETATGSFGSNLFSGRLEVGTKQVFGRFAVTPFAAVQFAELWQNGFTETNPVPAGAAGPLGLTYGSISVSSLPTFLGAQFDTRFAFANGMVLSPYARLSWVHEFNPTRSIDATFIALPGAAFTVDGPRASSDAARIDAGAKLAIGPNAWLYASFDGEFSDRGQSYAGKGGVRIAW